MHGRLALAYERARRFDEACYHWLQAGDLPRAKDALLANTPKAQPHVEAQLRFLVEQLELGGLADDPDIARFRIALVRPTEHQG